ncbi:MULTISPECIES: 2-keto-4-pentenoate hydratase [Acinetobacter calcoaceticus/baumannii complex]|uniref:2-keto-4-pentenoate hydratase n=1 Tax=Acinetobacter calcoaceticus/baumannii complex TaxID=909768 RepID=UPI002940C71E|nr:2-keto-4-pentenoate hydratase [Acinetobacter baumannii]MDV4328443.1 2-keto-4-pentenoate hydratase [Acinetobacter baumannii]MDV4331791.1 2-keto-4-pentenoate hydratase [Acinetobacter baumannii]
MSESVLLETTASALWHAEKTRKAIAPIRKNLGDESATVDVAYAIQQINTEQAIKNGRRLIGRKIGLTSKVVQNQLGVDQPDFGMLFADMAYGDGETIPFKRFIQPKVEAEIALVLQKDLTQIKHTYVDIISATAYALPAIEVVDSRIENWKISLIDTIADNASSAAFVLGSAPIKLENLDLANCKMQMHRKNEIVSEGQGKACLANPLNAAIWLADEMVKRGNPLRAGDIVLTGALGPMVVVSPGDEFVVEIDGFKAVKAIFGNEE